MFRLPKNSSQSAAKRQQNISHAPKDQGLCKFPHRKCNLLRLENYDYCLKHILEDKSAPYKPCPFLYTVSGKKCGKPSYRPERKDTWFCPEHSRKGQFLRQKASGRHAPLQTQEALLASLGHYARSDQTPNKKEDSETENVVADSSQPVNPFVELDAAQVNLKCHQILDYVSESDSDVEGAMLDNVWRSQDHESSDAESIDSQAEDPLKHAGVYTAEEATVVIKDKMIRLQSLYIDQFRRLQHLLKERRRKYLHALKKEKETLCSIHNQDKSTPKEHKIYQKLKALNHFHKYYGEEAILHKKALERRAQVTEGTIPRTSHKGKCAFTEGGVKCGAKTLPVTKYCRKHILEDNQQRLFRACGFVRDDHTCMEPTLNVFENATCVYHITLPSLAHNSANKLTTVKEELKSEVATDKDQPEKNSDCNQITAVEPPNSSEDKSSFELTNPNDTELRSDHEQLNTLPAEPLDQPAEQTRSVVEGNTLTTAEPNVEEKKQQMEEPKNDNLVDDLVMVDMITDVGVVEEVLESEVKAETEESMQVELLRNENVAENG